MWILVNAVAFFGYLLAGLLSRPRRPTGSTTTPSGDPAGWVMLIAWLAHALSFVLVLEGVHVLDFGFAPALSLTFWLVAAVYWVESLLYPLQGLRAWICLLAAGALVLSWYFPADRPPPAGAGTAFALHWAAGIAAYGVFGAAVLHGLMLGGAERALHRRRWAEAGVDRALPLLTLEKLTYRLTALGFALLSATLVFAIGFSERLFGRPFEFDHQTVLALAAWGAFAVLLAGRRWRGWRGHKALAWLYGGAALLLLSYVGSRFVLQVILHR